MLGSNSSWLVGKPAEDMQVKMDTLNAMANVVVPPALEGMDEIVLNYLKAKGYHRAEVALREQAGIKAAGVETIDEMTVRQSLLENASIGEFIKIYSEGDAEYLTERYEASYSRLCEWVGSSLDLYKTELSGILYPIFIHCFLDLIRLHHSEKAFHFLDRFKKEHMFHHGAEIRSLQSLRTIDHVRENDLAQSFLSHKFSIRMCKFTFDLLLAFLQDSSLRLILSLFNEHVHVEVFAGEPSQQEDEFFESNPATITGSTLNDDSALNGSRIRWGVIPTEEFLRKENPSINNKVKRPVGKTGQLTDAIKSSNPDAPSITDIPLPSRLELREVLNFEDARKRVALSSDALPSICQFTFFNARRDLNVVDISNDGSVVATGSADSSVRVWDIYRNYSVEKRGGSSVGSDPTVSLSNNNSTRSAPASATSSLGVNIPASGRLAVTTAPFGIGGVGYIGPTSADGYGGGDKDPGYISLIGHSGPVYGVSISPDRRYLLSCSEDRTTRLWSLATGTNLVAYKGHNYPVWDVSFSPVGHYFATASHDRTARLWSTDHMSPLRIFVGHLADVDCVAFHPNCCYVATGSSDKSLRLWDVQTGDCVRLFTGHFGAVNSLAISPDGRYLASGGDDGKVMLWDLGSGQKVKSMKGHTSSVWSVDFSAEGTILASGSADETVKLWEVLSSTTSDAAPEHSVNTNEKTNVAKPKLRIEISNKVDALRSFPTKRTPVIRVRFTQRNLLLSCGIFLGQD